MPFLQTSVDFLGYVIGQNGVSTDSRKIDKVVDWPTPTKLREVRSFLGLYSYYRRFVKGFSDLASPLHALTRKQAVFRWTAECQEAFETLKSRLVSSPVLALPCDEGQFILDTDASDHGIGAVLSQKQNGEEKVLCFSSRLYANAELNYCVTRKELLAVVFFVKQFKQYLLGREFLVRTDHAALHWLRRTPEPIGQQGRWLEILEGFTFTIEHRPGRLHTNADALSRRPCRQCTMCGNTVILNDLNLEKSAVVSFVTVSNGAWSPEQLRHAQTQDNDLEFIIEAKNTSLEPPPWETVVGASKVTKAYWIMWTTLEFHDRVLYRRYPPSGTRKSFLQIILPASYRKQFIEQVHAGFTGCHLGEKRTLEQVRQKAFWIGWTADVREFCKSCDACCSYWRGKAPRQGPLQKMSTGEPWERVGVDVTGPHPKSTSGHVYILTLMDYFTKWCEAFPMWNQEASTIAGILVDRVFSRFGTPLQILTDRGSNFESSLFQSLCKRLGIDHIRTTAYHPSTNGMIERFHRTLNTMLAKMVNESQRNWDQLLPSALAAYRATVHETTGFTPNMLFLGRETFGPIDILLGSPRDDTMTMNIHNFVEERTERMKLSYDIVRKHLESCAVTSKRYYDMRVRPQTFETGSWVWMFYPRRRIGKSPKWQRFYTGPYLVIKQLSPVTYHIQR